MILGDTAESILDDIGLRRFSLVCSSSVVIMPISDAHQHFISRAHFVERGILVTSFSKRTIYLQYFLVCYQPFSSNLLVSSFFSITL